jgi:hypothetical protein
MDWIKLYFSNRRYKIVMHSLYYLLCVSLTAKILRPFGIHNLLPKKLEIPVILAYFQDGTVWVPLLTFLLVFLLFSPANKAFNHLLYRAIRSKIPLFKGLRQGVTSIAYRLKWFRWADGKYQKMTNYEQFTTILRSIYGSPVNIMDFASRFNCVVLSFWLCLLFYPQGGALRTFYLFAGALFYIYHVMNLLFLREVKANIGFFKDIMQEIDREENLLVTIVESNVSLERYF